MFQEIVFDSNPVTLVGGGSVDAQDLHMAQALAPQVFAADGGAAHVLAAGHIPSKVIGDFDSLDKKTRALLPPDSLIHVTEQDSTDFEKALARIKAPLILGVGFTGARMDHALAVLHGLLRFAHKPVILLGAHEVILLAPPRLHLTMGAGDIVSLFPLVRCGGRSTGLEWAIDGLEMAPGDTIGTSNRALGGAMQIEMDTAGMVLMLPKPALGQVTQALLDCAPVHGQWPARA